MRKAECHCCDDGMAHLRQDILSHFRGADHARIMGISFAPEGVALPQGGSGRYPKRGAGNAGCPLHPQPRVVV